MKFAIGIPTLNRYDLLKPSLEKYIIDFPDTEIFIIDNGNQHIERISDNITIITPKKNMGVAASWNMLCQLIYKEHDYALILNDDVYLGYGTATVWRAIETCPYLLTQSAISWSVFILPQVLYDFFGAFDETFYPAYYEDSDYLYRMKLEGVIQHVDTDLNPSIINISMTQEKDPELVNASMQANRLRYIDKWGGSPLLETFTTPYNHG